MRMSNVIYMPQAKWKSGERRAIRTAAYQSERLVPLFKVTPAGSFDPEEQRVLTPTEYLGRFGHQLAECRGRRLAFIDGNLVDDDRHSQAVNAHPLTAILERCRLMGANASPVFGRDSSSDYLSAVSRFVQRQDDTITCFRVSLADLEEIESALELQGYAQRLGCPPGRTVLLIDGGPLRIDDADELAHLLALQLSRLLLPNVWLRIFWSATTLPDKPKLTAGSLARFPRNDWRVYEAILRFKSEFAVVPMFSDYMLEYPSDYRPIRVSPTAKLSYSSEVDYILAKGKSTKVGDKYKNIFPVAEQLVSIPEMKDPSFSLGDLYIHRLASRTGKTGNASMWKWCSLDHHLAIVDHQLTDALGITRDRTPVAAREEQLQLV